MATSVFLARLLGPLLLAVGAGILINPKPFHTMAGEVIRSVTLVYLFGLADLAPDSPSCSPIMCGSRTGAC